MTDNRRIIAVFVLGALIATAAFIGMGVNAQDSPGAGEGGSDSITVSASGEASAEPDRAVINLAAEATSEDANEARESLASRVSSMREALRDAGLSDDRIRTTDFSIHERREPVRPVREGERPQTETTYVARHEFEIELGDLDRIGEIIDVAVSNGASQVSNVQYTLSEDRRRQVKSSALEDAMGNARSQAGTLAGSAGVGVGGVQSISTADVGVSPVQFQARALTEDAGGTQVETGPVTVTAQVTVEYGIN